MTPLPAGASGTATTSWQYDDLGRVVKETGAVPAAGQSAPVTAFSYNADSELTGEIDPLGRTQTTTFDGLGRQRTQTSFTAVETAWTYNNLSQVLTTTVGTGSLAETTTNTWDALGRELSTQDAGGGLTQMSYDLAGNMLSLTDPSQNKTVWQYNALNEVTSETNQLNASRTFQYDANGDVVEETDRDGRVREFEFNHLGQQTAEKWMNGATSGGDLAVFNFNLGNGGWEQHALGGSISANTLANSTSAPVAHTGDLNEQDLFVVGADGLVREDRYSYATQRDDGLVVIDANTKFDPAAKLTAFTVGSTVNVFGVGQNGQALWAQYTATGGWTGFVSLDSLTSDPGVTFPTGTALSGVVQGGSLDLFAVGTDGHVKRYVYAGGVWTSASLDQGNRI